MEMWNRETLKAMEGMRRNGFNVIEKATAKEAKDCVLDLMKPGESIGIGGSMTVKELGLIPELENKGVIVQCHTGHPKEEQEQIRRKAMEADAYLCSANAVTSDGKLVLVDGSGNRVAAVCYGPKRLIFVIGQNKIVDGGMAAAIGRVKTVAAPLNCKRLGIPNDCAEKGSCAGAECKRSICNLTLSVDKVPSGRDVTVVLVREKLGY